MTLLQIHEPIEQGLISQLGDQIFSIVLLVFFAIYSIRRQMKLEDKFQAYQDEDRKKMQDVIAENTKALETINIKLGSRLAVFVIGAGLLLGSCSVLKKHTEIRTNADSVISHVRVSTVDFQHTERESKDTVINLDACSAEGEITAPDLTPIYTLSGDTLARSHTIKGDGITVDLSVKKDGSLSVKAHTDAKQLVVPNLIRETLIQSKARDSTGSTDHKGAATVQVADTKRNTLNWPTIGFVALFALALFLYLFRFLKRLWIPQP